jgi:hypothetical protein
MQAVGERPQFSEHAGGLVSGKLVAEQAPLRERVAAHEHRDAGEARPGPAYTPREALQPGPDNVVEREPAQPERRQDRRDPRAAAYGDIREAVDTNRCALHQRERPVRPQRRATALERRPFLRRGAR